MRGPVVARSILCFLTSTLNNDHLLLSVVLACYSIVMEGALVIPWTVCSVEPGISFPQLFQNLQSGSIDLFRPNAFKAAAVRLMIT